MTFAALVIQPTPALASVDDDGAWLIISMTGDLRDDDGRWLFWTDAQARAFDLGSGRYQRLIRPAVGYAWRPGLRAWLGYARFNTGDRAGNLSTEHRFWQQVDWTGSSWQGGRITLRARLLQRLVSSGDDTGIVLRLMGKYTRPVESSEGTQLILSVESFLALNDTDWGGDAGLRQNRVFIGLGRRLSDRTAIEAGYMNQYLWRDDAEDRSNHLAMLNFRFTY